MGIHHASAGWEICMIMLRISRSIYSREPATRSLDICNAEASVWAEFADNNIHLATSPSNMEGHLAKHSSSLVMPHLPMTWRPAAHRRDTSCPCFAGPLLEGRKAGLQDTGDHINHGSRTAGRRANCERELLLGEVLPGHFPRPGYPTPDALRQSPDYQADCGE